MTEQATWLRWLRMGREDVAWGTAPANELEYNMNGGKWMSFITASPLGALKRIEAKHRSKGATGQRSIDQHVPVSAAHRSEGALEIPFVSDVGGLLLRCALGADSAADTNDAAIITAGVINEATETFDGGELTQPTATKYPYVKFVVTEDTPGTANAGTVVITGTDPADRTISETIVTPALTAAQSYTVYSKLSYKTVTSIVVTGWATGTAALTATGIVQTAHTITCADTSGSLSIDEHSDPAAGAGNIWRYTGLVIPQLNLAFAATEEEGLFVITPTLAGKFPTAVADPTYRLPPLTPWPSWVCSVTRGGVANAKIQAANFQINTGTRLRRAATGSQDPAGVVDGGRTVAISGRMWFDDNTEYADWVNNALANYEFTFASPYKVTSTTYQNLLLECTELVWITYDPIEDEGLIVADFTAYTKAHSSDNVLKATLANTKNGAY